MMRRSRSRGVAAIELLLSAPVLLLFMVLILDFARGIKTRQGIEIATRHQAWSKARARNRFEPGHPVPQSAEKTLAVHREGVGERLRVDYWPYKPLRRMEGKHDKNFVIVPTAYRPIVRAPLGALRSAINVLKFGGPPWESEVWDYVAGKITIEGAHVTQPIKRLRVLDAGEVDGKHYVQLWTHPDPSPGNPLGWWNPWPPLADKLGLPDMGYRRE